MNRRVAVGFGERHPVAHLLVIRIVIFCKHGKGFPTLNLLILNVLAVDDDTCHIGVINLFERHAELHHTFPHRAHVTLNSHGANLYATLLQLSLDGSQKLLQLLEFLISNLAKLFLHRFKHLRVDIFQTEVVELKFHLIKTQSVGNRGINLGCLRCDFQLFMMRHRT